MPRRLQGLGAWGLHNTHKKHNVYTTHMEYTEHTEHCPLCPKEVVFRVGPAWLASWDHKQWGEQFLPVLPHMGWAPGRRGQGTGEGLGVCMRGSGAGQGRVGVPCRVVKEGWGSLVSWYIREVSPRPYTVASEMAGCLGLEFPHLLPTQLPWDGVELVRSPGCCPPERGRQGSPSSRRGG